MDGKTNHEYILAYNQLLKECDTIYHNAAARAGVSDCAFWILYTVYDSKKTYTQSQICDESFMPRQTVNSALKKLEKDAYLILQRTPGKIGKTISLTDKGRQFAQTHILPMMAAEERACDWFSEEEKEQFFHLFRMLVDRLQCEVKDNDTVVGSF